MHQWEFDGLVGLLLYFSIELNLKIIICDVMQISKGPLNIFVFDCYVFYTLNCP